MVETVYSLLLGASLNTDYSAGWLAGSIPAHLISCELYGKIFWFCPVQFGRGPIEGDKGIFKELIEKIINSELKIGDVYKGLKLDKYGYFFDNDSQEVAWRFKLEQIFSGNYFKKHPNEQIKYEKYFSFREVYLDYSEKDSANCYWFLLSDIQQMKNPMKSSDKKIAGGYEIPGFKYADRNLSTHDFIYSAVFVSDIPETCKITKIVKAEDEINDHLKQFLLLKMPEKTLREKVIQNAFAVMLMTKYKNWTLTLEEKLGSGTRPDILFRDEKGSLVVVEIKKSDNDDPVTQLKGYIDELKAKHSNIRGIIICGKISEDLKEKAKKEKFDIIEYSISIGFKSLMKWDA
jgi:hypothetical protein